MSTINQILEIYYTVQASLKEVLNVNFDYPLFDYRHCPFYQPVGSVGFKEDGEYYRFEQADEMKTLDDIRVLFCRENGEKFYALFDMNNLVSEEVFEEWEE